MVLPLPRSHEAEAAGLGRSPCAKAQTVKVNNRQVKRAIRCCIVSPTEPLAVVKNVGRASWKYVSRPPLCSSHSDGYNRRMPVFDEKQEELEHYETMMGVPRGRLAVTMDMITDAMALVGQHGVYCQSQRWPGKPVLDIQLVMKGLTDAKELIQSVMAELSKPPQKTS